MNRFVRVIQALVATALLTLPLVAAQADTDKGGDVPIPPPRATTPPPAPAAAEEPVSALPAPYLTLETTSLAAGIGVTWGEGTLSYEGMDHAFSVRGVSLFDIGASVTDGLGEVYNLSQIEDFEGTYVAVGAAGAAGVGKSTTRMRNDHGVEIELRSDLKGVEFALATQGFSIRLK